MIKDRETISEYFRTSCINISSPIITVPFFLEIFCFDLDHLQSIDNYQISFFKNLNRRKNVGPAKEGSVHESALLSD